jgi:hypothetical protein
MIGIDRINSRSKMSEIESRYNRAIEKLKKLSHVTRIGSSCDNTLVSVVYEFFVGEVVYTNKE